MKRVIAVMAIFAAMVGVAHAQVGSYWVGQAWHTGGVKEYQSKPNSIMMQSWTNHLLEIHLHICDLDGTNCHREYTIHATGRYDVGSGPTNGSVFAFHASNGIIRDYTGHIMCRNGMVYAGGQADSNAFVVETFFDPASCTAPLPGRQFIHVRQDTSFAQPIWVAEISLER